jgi:hypothetical protein
VFCRRLAKLKGSEGKGREGKGRLKGRVTKGSACKVPDKAQTAKGKNLKLY